MSYFFPGAFPAVRPGALVAAPEARACVQAVLNGPHMLRGNTRGRLQRAHAGAIRAALNGRFVKSGLPFLVQDCRWSNAYKPANYLVLLLNFLHETGCDGTGCVVSLMLTTTPLSSFPPWDGGTVVMPTARPQDPPTGSLGCRRVGRVERLQVLRALPGAIGMVRLSNLETAYG